MAKAPKEGKIENEHEVITIRNISKRDFSDQDKHGLKWAGTAYKLDSGASRAFPAGLAETFIDKIIDQAILESPRGAIDLNDQTVRDELRAKVLSSEEVKSNSKTESTEKVETKVAEGDDLDTMSQKQLRELATQRGIAYDIKDSKVILREKLRA